MFRLACLFCQPLQAVRVAAVMPETLFHHEKLEPNGANGARITDMGASIIAFKTTEGFWCERDNGLVGLFR